MTVIPLPVAPSPKFQLNCVMLWPGADFEMSALKKIVWPAIGAAGENTKSAKGADGKPTVTVCDVDADVPRSLVTVNVTTNVPEDVNACVVVTPVLVVPSPKFHA